PGTGSLYRRDRAAIASMLKDYGLLSLLWVLPLAVGQTLVRIVYYLLSRRFEDAYQATAAWGWNLAHLIGTGRRRARAQSVRAVPDRRVRQYMAPSWIRLDRWTRNMVESLRPAREFASLEDRPTAWSRAASLAVAHPVAVG